jgi:hypothetical protein
MKTKIYILVLVFLAIMGFLNAQTEAAKTSTLLLKTDPGFRNADAHQLHLTAAEKANSFPYNGSPTFHHSCNNPEHLLYQSNGMDEAWNGTAKGSSTPVKQDVTGHVSLIR